MFTWYWLADQCRRENIAFVLGHALYMRAIHVGKAKNDRVAPTTMASPSWNNDAREPRGLIGRPLPLQFAGSKVFCPSPEPGAN